MVERKLCKTIRFDLFIYFVFFSIRFFHFTISNHTHRCSCCICLRIILSNCITNYKFRIVSHDESIWRNIIQKCYSIYNRNEHVKLNGEDRIKIINTWTSLRSHELIANFQRRLDNGTISGYWKWTKFIWKLKHLMKKKILQIFHWPNDKYVHDCKSDLTDYFCLLQKSRVFN